MCSVCESLGKNTPLQWIAQYQRWYCYECKQYTPASNSNVDTSTAKIETNRSVLFCSKCGKETLPEAKFCRFCGNSLTPTQTISPKTDQFTLLPSENVMLSLKNAKLEQKEPFLGTTTLGGRRIYVSADGQLRVRESSLLDEIDRISADFLLITDKRMHFIDKGRLIREIIIDKEYAQEFMRTMCHNNYKARLKFEEAQKKASKLERWGGSVRARMLDCGFYLGPIFLLKNAERKDRIMRKPEVQLDIFEFVDIPGEPVTHNIPKGVRIIIDGHLTFSDLEQLSDKLLNSLEPKFAAMTDYIESKQYITDFYNS